MALTPGTRLGVDQITAQIKASATASSFLLRERILDHDTGDRLARVQIFGQHSRGTAPRGDCQDQRVPEIDRRIVLDLECRRDRQLAAAKAAGLKVVDITRSTARSPRR